MGTTKTTAVAFFFTSLHLGGTERQALLLIDGVDRKRYTVYAYALQDGPLRAELAKRSVTVRVFGAAPHKLRSTVLAVREAVVNDKIDILHCLLWHPNIIGRLACRGTHTRCINSVRWAESPRLRDVFDYPTRGLVHHWIANSKHGAALARLPKDKTTIIANGLDDSILATPLSRWKPKPKTAVMVAQFRREKQYAVLIRAAAQLPGWQFMLVGDGPQLARCKKLAQVVGANNVQFAGHRTDVREILLRSSVCILLSRSEGSPNVTLEAMALGVPVVGSDIPAHTLLLGQNRGFLTQPLPAAVARTITTLPTPQTMLAVRRSAQRYVREHYSSALMVEQTQAVWKMLGSTKT